MQQFACCDLKVGLWGVGAGQGQTSAFQEPLSSLPALHACQPQPWGGPDCCSAEAAESATPLWSQASSQALTQPGLPRTMTHASLGSTLMLSLLHCPAGLARAAGVKSQRRAAASGCATSNTVQVATAPRRSSCRARRLQTAPMAAVLCESHSLHCTTCCPARSCCFCSLGHIVVRALSGVQHEVPNATTAASALNDHKL